MTQTTLKGTTWNHSRAYPPPVAAAQRFEEEHPGVAIAWERRSLHAFGHASLAELCARYDLIVVDHPMMGEAHERGLLVDLGPHLGRAAVEEMSADTIGASYASYVYEGHLYALPIDAAAPVASSRPDLLARHDLAEPASWAELVALAQRGLARMPGFPADLFLNFMGLCVSRGAAWRDEPVERAIALECLELLRELACSMPDAIYGWNPIALYEHMAGSDEFAYCPFAYSYSNYARPGFARHPLRFSAPVALPDGRAVRTILGGTGIAVSQASERMDEALAFAAYVQGAVCQRTVYALAGGQPARRSAWLDPTLNGVAGDFFLATLACTERAVVRPRYAGYVPFQEQAGVPIAEYLQSEGRTGDRRGRAAERALDRVDALYRQSVAQRERRNDA